MASKNLLTRETQKNYYVKKNEARIEALLSKGLTQAVVKKDPQVKHFKARIKQIGLAIARISFLEDQTKKLQEKKELRKAEAEAARAVNSAGETKKKDKKKAEEKKPETGKKKPAAAGKAPTQGKQQPKKK